METDKDYVDVMKEHLAKQQNDYVGAIKLLPKKTMLFYIHALQSYIYNEEVALMIKSLGDAKTVTYSQGEFSFLKQPLVEVEQEQITLVGYSSTLNSVQEQILSDLDIEQRNFLIPQFPNLCVEGGNRPLYSQVKDFKVLSYEKKEKKATVTFVLKKGSYATIVLKQVF